MEGREQESMAGGDVPMFGDPFPPNGVHSAANGPMGESAVSVRDRVPPSPIALHGIFDPMRSLESSDESG